MITKPATTEFIPYMTHYIDLVPENDLLPALLHAGAVCEAIARSIPEEHWDYRYAPDKWTIKELMVHLTDSERIFAYRALCIARGEQQALPGFEEDQYVVHSQANRLHPAQICADLQLLRASTVQLFSSFPEESFLKTGVANGNTVSVRAIGYAIAGHQLHHLHILKTRYLQPV